MGGKGDVLENAVVRRGDLRRLHHHLHRRHCSTARARRGQRPRARDLVDDVALPADPADAAVHVRLIGPRRGLRDAGEPVHRVDPARVRARRAGCDQAALPAAQIALDTMRDIPAHRHPGRRVHDDQLRRHHGLDGMVARLGTPGPRGLRARHAARLPAAVVRVRRQRRRATLVGMAAGAGRPELVGRYVRAACSLIVGLLIVAARCCGGGPRSGSGIFHDGSRHPRGRLDVLPRDRSVVPVRRAVDGARLRVPGLGARRRRWW